MKRLESDLKREIASKHNAIEELKSENKLKTTAHLSDMAQLNSEKHSLEEEITSLRYARKNRSLLIFAAIHESSFFRQNAIGKI
jgi:hypothetical protein